MVVAWHFIHFNHDSKVKDTGAPSVFPFAVFHEGHTGVALFMVLSGYLFAKLLDGRIISFPAFLWNRLVRLAPLLLLTLLLVGVEHYVRGENVLDYVLNLPQGFVYPVWPNGGWSITTEIHFYLILPFLLYISRRGRLLPLSVIVAALVFRAYYHHTHGQVQSVAYWTIVGRIDHFVLGMVAFFYAAELTKSRKLLVFSFIAFTAFWWWFDVTGGFYFRPAYPSPSPIWIWLPTIEGLAYSALILWYDSKMIDPSTLTSRVAQRLGEYSYSIYLLHFFVVFRAAAYIDRNIMDLSNFYISLAWSLAFFLLMLAPGYVSFRYIETPFLKLRRRYTIDRRTS